jgi:hypothetical protein
MMEEENLTKVHCKHIWKHYNEPPYTHTQLIYANKNVKNKISRKKSQTLQ